MTNIGGIQAPFTIGIQTSNQLELMLTWGPNEAIWMDVSFGINDVKFHLFILMVFWFTLDWDPSCMDCHFLANIYEMIW
jgi:hypothetical protein